MISIELISVTRRYGSIPALDGVSMDFAAGAFTALLGPSGCGKTTMLRLIAGFEAPDQGRILFDGRLIADVRRQVPPEKRGIAVVFQSYALWPHMDVAGNVGYPLGARGADRRAADSQIAAALEVVGLDGFQLRRIEELSGGQRQRVALARCLVAEAGIILFDEPLANLDMHLRASMLDSFRLIHARTKATIIYVTHDQSEALALADRVAVMDRGKVLQIASPFDVYQSPANERVAGFVGRGALVTAQSVDKDRATIGGRAIGVRMRSPGSGPGKVLLRPEGLRLAADGLAAIVTSVIYRGPSYEVWVELAGSREKLVLDCSAAPSIGETVRIEVADAWLIPDSQTLSPPG